MQHAQNMQLNEQQGSHQVPFLYPAHSRCPYTASTFSPLSSTLQLHCPLPFVPIFTSSPPPLHPCIRSALLNGLLPEAAALVCPPAHPPSHLPPPRPTCSSTKAASWPPAGGAPRGRGCSRLLSSETSFSGPATGAPAEGGARDAAGGGARPAGSHMCCLTAHTARCVI